MRCYHSIDNSLIAYDEDEDNESDSTAHLGQESQDLLGCDVLYNLSRDAIVLMICEAMKMYSFGFLSVMLVIYLIEVGYSVYEVGLLLALTLLGDAFITIVITRYSMIIGRKNTLVLGALLAVLTSLIFVTQTNFWWLLISSILGVISPSANYFGPFTAIEMSAIAQVTSGQHRTKLMAWYNLIGCFSSAFGALTTGLLLRSLVSQDYSYTESCRIVLLIYTLIQSGQVVLFMTLGPEVETPFINPNLVRNSPMNSLIGLHKSKWIVLKLSALIMIDSFASSLILQSIVSNWFLHQFHTPLDKIGSMIFICNMVSGISAIFAAKLADIIGQIVTMVVTHLPSNILIIMIPLMPSENLAIALLCVSYSVSEMDIPIRNAYLQDVVDPDERASANGVINVAQSIGGCIGPYIAGLLYAQDKYSSYPFFIAGGLKIIYDIALLLFMSSVQPKHEQLKFSSRSYDPSSIFRLSLGSVSIDTLLHRNTPRSTRQEHDPLISHQKR